jgi:hypothetical protein
MKRVFSTFILLILFLSGCNEVPPPYPTASTPPSCIHGGDAGTVGMCGPHMNGNAAQEKVAMDRALETLAKQQESKVRTGSTSSQQENGLGYSSSYNSSTQVEATTTVKAHIVSTWRDPQNNNYYVLMKMD